MDKKKIFIVRFLGAFKSSVVTFTKIFPYIKKKDNFSFFFKIVFSQLIFKKKS